MWKRLLLVTAVSAAMSSMAIAAPLTVGFSQVGSESGWRAAETSVAKEEAAKRGITLKIADGQQKQENQIKAVRSFIAQRGRRDLHCAGGGHRLGTGAERGERGQDPGFPPRPFH